MSFPARFTFLARVIHQRTPKLARQLALDLGTSRTRLHLRGTGLVADEPTAVVMEPYNAGVAATGNKAIELVASRTEADLSRPIRHGVAADAAVLEAFVSALLKPHLKGVFDRQHAVVTVPSATTPVERRIVRECVTAAGVDNVHTIEHVLAGALGAHLPIHDAIGSMIIDVGAGITEAALLSLGAVVAASSIRLGSADIDEEIRTLMRRDYGMRVTDKSAEEIKTTAAALLIECAGKPREDQLLIEAGGTSVTDGSEVVAILEIDDIAPMLSQFRKGVVDVVRSTLVQAPPDLGQDLFSQGIHLVGGGALTPLLVEDLERAFSLPVHLVDDAERVVVNGAAECLEAPEAFSSLFLGEKGQV